MWLRPSTTSYSGFSLDMDRSPGFGPASADFRSVKTWFPCGSGPEALSLASTRSSPDRSTKSTRSQRTRSTHSPRHELRMHASAPAACAAAGFGICITHPLSWPGKSVERSVLLPQLAGTAFQVLFHSPPGVLFTFPSRYSSLSVTG